MSESDDGPGRREVAHRLFATEYDDASLEFSESDEERAPNYVVTPTGARVNRLLIVGVLTAVEPVNDETVRARVVDPTGAFVIYAGQYQPDELAFFERADPPTFVAITGKANAFSPDDSDRVLTSVRPESVNEVDEDTRDRWVVTTAEQTLSRIGVIADALDRPERGGELAAFLRANGIDHATASGVALALDHYDTGPDYLGVLRNVALDAARVVAGETDEVRELDLQPATRQGEFDSAVLAERSPTGPAVEATDAASAGRVDDTGESGSASADGEAGTASGDDEGAATASGDDEGAATSPGSNEDAGRASGGEEDAATGGEETATSTPSSAREGSETANGADSDETESSASGDVGAGSDGASKSTESTGTASAGGSSLENFDDGTAADDASGDPSASEASTPPETDEMYEFDEEEREQIEEEHGLEFSTGSEVDAGGTGEAAQGTDPEREDAETASEQVDDAAAGGTEGNDSEAETPAEEESTTVADDGDDADDRGDGDDADDDADLDEVLLDRMAALDDGDGADRSALVDAVVEATGVSEADVEDAIEDALMSGQCYEPDDETLKPI